MSGSSMPPKNNYGRSAIKAEADDEQADSEAVTCSALCSLKSSTKNGIPVPPAHMTERDYQMDDNFDCSYVVGSAVSSACRRRSNECTDHLQLPMFLSKTYHMIDRCDDDIATWSENGDNFVVKNVDKFASHVLPLYFKHSNFSSFARQLNFYGFRKLRTDPILTSDVDPCTASFVRFYHEKFQRGKPDLLQHIKRATKTDQHSKDDIESLRSEIADLKDLLRSTTENYDRKLAELSYECNRRITAMNAEYDNLAALVHRVLGIHQASASAIPPHQNLSTLSSLTVNSATKSNTGISSCPSLRAAHQALNTSSFSHLSTNSNSNVLSNGPLQSTANPSIQLSMNADLLQSLSHVAVWETLRAQQNSAANSGEGGKRAAPDGENGRSDSPRARLREV